MKVENTSGIEPLGRAVLVLPYNAEQSVGMIALPDQVVRANQLAEQKAVVMAIGPLAWAQEPSPRCKVGDHIQFARWAGHQVPGMDGQIYRAVNDNDIFLKLNAT